MNKKRWRFLGVLVTLTLLLCGCFGGGYGPFGAFGGYDSYDFYFSEEDQALREVLPEIEPGVEYPVCLDERLHYGMTDTEVKTVLGEPEGIGEDNEFLPMTTLYYPWSLDGQKAELDLGFLTVGGEQVLCSVNLYVYCEEGEEGEIVDSLENLLHETYGDLPGFSCAPMDSDLEGVWLFGMDLGDTGISGDIMASPGMVAFTCMAG